MKIRSLLFGSPGAWLQPLEQMLRMPLWHQSLNLLSTFAFATPMVQDNSMFRAP